MFEQKENIRNEVVLQRMRSRSHCCLRITNQGKLTPTVETIQKELNALQKNWQKQVNEARTPADFKALESIFGEPKD
jgi:hypothetical protein